MSPEVLALAAAIVPGGVGFVVSRLAQWNSGRARLASAASSGLSLALALLCAAGYALGAVSSDSSLWLELPGGARLSLGARVDGLTVLMLLAVTLLGAVVSRFSLRYLDGDPGQVRFCQWLSYTLSAVLLLVVASNLVLFFAAWVATSHGLHQLLTFYPDRPAALIAARKKFLTSRLGDLLLLAAFVGIYRSFGSFEFAEILPRAGELEPGAALAIATALVLGAMTKSAQLPFHSWLPDTMETPTPVSALMHAGIINAGGFLLIRMSPLLVEAPVALGVLAAGGATTALFGSLVMLTQTDVKRKYAYSTVSQMGFMMLQCGLGAFGPAALHLVGHAFYKAYAFLSSGSVVSTSPAPSPRGTGPASAASIVLATGAGVLIVAALAFAWIEDPLRKPGFLVLGGILALAVGQMLLTSSRLFGTTHAWLRATRDGALMAAVYFVGVSLVEGLLGAALPGQAWQPGLGDVLLALGLWVAFFLALLLQTRLPEEGMGRLLGAAYVHAHNGFYIGVLQNQVVRALWPTRAAKTGGELSCP